MHWKQQYEVALLAFLGDNLAAHQIGGSMSFAYCICRSCMATTGKAQNNFTETKFELRTPENHIKQCILLEQNGQDRSEVSKRYGKSVLENINFSVVQNLPHDIMHDLLEGVIPYEMKNMLIHFVNNCHYFFFRQLNERLLNYEFGYTEIASVLHDIKPQSNLRQQHHKCGCLLLFFLFSLVISFLKLANTGTAFYFS